jgi:hypothetical protein
MQGHQGVRGGGTKEALRCPISFTAISGQNDDSDPNHCRGLHRKLVNEPRKLNEGAILIRKPAVQSE